MPRSARPRRKHPSYRRRDDAPCPITPPPRARRRCRVAAGLAALATTLQLLAPAAWGAPDEGECPTLEPVGTDGERLEDAAPVVLEPGMIVEKDALLSLRSLLPEELWKYREFFFHEGMQMEIGPCHRRYVVPAFFREATARFAGKPKLGKNGSLERYTAGLPFPPESIDEDASDAAIRWAWNFAKRYRGPGHRGRMRIRSYPVGMGSVQTYRGDFTMLKSGERADLIDDDYRVPDAKDMLWASGGEFTHPFAARGLAWRQYRVEKSMRKWEEPDDIFVYVPEMRKIRRAATNWVDGVYLPKFTWAGQSGGGGVNYGESGGVNPTAGVNIGSSEDARMGFTGLAIRPNAYVWRMRGRQIVIAPINGRTPGWPTEEERNYGYAGLSVAEDRWDVRSAIVIEGALKRRNETIRTVTIFVDELTQHPLYWISRTDRRRLVEVGIFVHRYTGDVDGYPEMPGGTPAYIFEPVAASFFNALSGRGGWLRESYDMRSLPFDDSDRREVLSADSLLRGH